MFGNKSGKNNNYTSIGFNNEIDVVIWIPCIVVVILYKQ